MTKRLGQYFLVNKRKIKRFSDALELCDGDVVIEIGPGKGAITKNLRRERENVKVIAIEKDQELAHNLESKIKNLGSNTEIIVGDALKILPDLTSHVSHLTSRYKLVGNLPFYITGRFLRMLGELEHKPEIAVLGLQKEVAERLVAVPPRMNLLAATVQFWSEPKIIANISRKDFKPQPEVDAAIVKLRIKNQESRIENNLYYKTVKIIFRQPRKTILNNLLLAGTKKEEAVMALKKSGIDPKDRPQTLSVNEIERLSHVLALP